MHTQSLPHSPGPAPIHAGSGRISLTSYGSDAVFSELVSTYPLKLLAPRITRNGVGVVYLLTYGGGLVGGDEVQLSVNVDSRTVLVMLSQGSTKVFKVRPGERLASARPSRRSSATEMNQPAVKATVQNMSFTIGAGGALLLLPDPVTCFRSASYNQTQAFHLSKNASIVVLDWLTSGRMSMREEWAFSRYYSVNEVWVEGKRIARDVMLLDEEQDSINEGNLPSRTMSDRLAPYSCYAMVILYGPLVETTILNLSALYDQISIFKAKAPEDILWSLSPVSDSGVIVRVAGKETETVKRWLGQSLQGLQDAVGREVFQKAFQ